MPKTCWINGNTCRSCPCDVKHHSPAHFDIRAGDTAVEGLNDPVHVTHGFVGSSIRAFRNGLHPVEIVIIAAFRRQRGRAVFRCSRAGSFPEVGSPAPAERCRFNRRAMTQFLLVIQPCFARHCREFGLQPFVMRNQVFISLGQLARRPPKTYLLDRSFCCADSL